MIKIKLILIKLQIVLYKLFKEISFAIKKLKSSKSIKRDVDLKEYLDKDFSSSKPSIIIYAATIGELRAAKHFISCLQNKFHDLQLAIVPGQLQYASVFSNIYPDAIVFHEFPSTPSIVEQAFETLNPKYCFFIEGPSLHGFFPIRQDLSLAVACLQHKVPLFVINACLYEKSIASRYDLVEHVLFSNLMQEAIVQWFVPNPPIENSFLDFGIPRRKLFVSGDIKLDNIYSDPLPPVSENLRQLLEFYSTQNCRLIVAGSVNEYDEQVALIQAWMAIKEEVPNVVLVLVPRYINNHEMMKKLYHFLDDQNIEYTRRSEGLEALEKDKLLIIDVFGELPYFYEFADIAFAGRGHGVLEPMKFSKPVVVGPRNAWKKVGSTAFYLFEQFLDKNALIECENYSELSKLFIRLLTDAEYGESYINRYKQFISEQMGASERIINHLESISFSQSGTD